MKTSDKLYNLNADLSLMVGLKRLLNLNEMINLNLSLGEIIEEIRELEDKII